MKLSLLCSNCKEFGNSKYTVYIAYEICTRISAEYITYNGILISNRRNLRHKNERLEADQNLDSGALPPRYKFQGQ